MSRWSITLQSAAFMLAVVLIIAPAGAVATGRADFAEAVVVGDQTLTLMGSGVLRYRRLIKVYTGALYTVPGLAPEAVLANTPKRLEVVYLRAFKGADFGPATYSGLAKNISAAEIERLRPRIEQHNQLYVDVAPGDRYALTYLPGVGTELALNGQPRGVVEGADFAAALFSMWLGERPLDEPFKRALLGLER
jgi:hypothetical protein